MLLSSSFNIGPVTIHTTAFYFAGYCFGNPVCFLRGYRRGENLDNVINMLLVVIPLA
jgi:hypothetical protein